MDAVITPPTQMGSDSIIVSVDARASMRDLERMPRGAERKAEAWNRLVETAGTSQAPLRELADKLVADGVVSGYETLVSPNALVLDPAAGKARTVLEAFSTADGVRAMYDNRGNVKFREGAFVDARDGAGLIGDDFSGLDLYSQGDVVEPSAVERPYGLDMVGAPQAWERGADGRGLVYGSIDTGVDHTHEALAAKYRGRADDGSLVHDRSWFDFGRGRTLEPTDSHGHGSHTTGTVVGGTGETQIGVAPGAKWIGVNGLKGGLDVRLKALQFMQAPTNLDGTAPDPTMAPDVVGMSWWTGPATSDAFQESLANLRAAGIQPVKSMGNKGPHPESGSAPGQFEEILSTAAVGPDGDVAKFSSRGPSAFPHEGRRPMWKPDIAAPGVDTLSAVPGDRYRTMSGTSMAQPHLSGVVLGLLSSYPGLSNSQLEQVLAESAVDAGAGGRDLEFGHGIANLDRALDVAAARFPEAAAAAAAAAPQPTA